MMAMVKFREYFRERLDEKADSQSYKFNMNEAIRDYEQYKS